MTPEEAQRVGYALVGLLDAIGKEGDLAYIGRVFGGEWYAYAHSHRLRGRRWPLVTVWGRSRPSLADALDVLAVKIRERESRRRP